MNNMKCIRIEADQKQILRGKEMVQVVGDLLVQKAKIFNLLGNDVRLKILFLLHNEDQLCVCDLSDILSMNVSAISQHLRKLKDGGLVVSLRKAQTIYYSIATEQKDLLTILFQNSNLPVES